MSGEAEDEYSISFAIGFYEAITAGENVHEAFRLACLRPDLQGLSQSAKPRLIEERISAKNLCFVDKLH